MDQIISSGVCQFDRFRFDRRRGRLIRLDADGAWRSVSLSSRALEALGVLLEQHGNLVSKDELIRQVWAGTAVEDSNLTVQISALRRVIDEGRNGESCIQTVSGKGYRFLLPATQVVEDAEPSPTDAAPVAPAAAPMAARRPAWQALAVVLGGLAVALVVAVLVWQKSGTDAQSGRPRLSIVVLPFQNLSGDAKDNYLADGVTDDLTSDLAHIPGAFVIASASAYSYRSKAEDVRQVGNELGVRFAVHGSVRRIDQTLRVDVQLASTETGAQLWSDRFDHAVSDLAEGQEAAVIRMRSALNVTLTDIAAARSLRDRQSNPDAFDFILRARALHNQPPSLERKQQALALYERALQLDPSSAIAMAKIASFLVERRASGTATWGTFANLRRAETLLTRARAIAPDSEVVLGAWANWLRYTRHCSDSMVAASELIRRFPNNSGGYFILGKCKEVTGHAEEAIPLMQDGIRLDPRDPELPGHYQSLGFASMLLGRDHDAINYLLQSLALNPANDGWRFYDYTKLATAYARTGQMAEAKRAVADANRLNPYYTVRMHVPDGSSDPVYHAQMLRYQDGLRLAGARDHADEDEDLQVPADNLLHDRMYGPTPTTAPGATTIRTADLVALLAKVRPVVIDASFDVWDASIPGSIGLDGAGLGGSFDDGGQDHVRRKMLALTGNDVSRPVVAVGWNSEDFEGRNLALRLVALGYTNVWWYRGGREAWDVNGEPKSESDVQEW